MSVPTAEDLAGPGPHSLDEMVVLRHFLGRTADEIRSLLPADDTLQEDFMWMHPGGLRYYLPAVLDYLKSRDSENDFVMSFCMLGSLSVQAERVSLPKDVRSIVLEIASTVEAAPEKYGIDRGDPDLERHMKAIRAGCRGR